ncbi:MAG: EamA family transporter [Methylobacteriaceae bacterium]|nr:EamA family transporter [Methylobacteriaceae bacterium]
MTTSRATAVGLVAVALWSCLALLTAASGAAPPFLLSALTFAIGGLGGLIAAAARGRLSALRQPASVWLVGVGGLFGYHAVYFAALRAAPPEEASLIAFLWPLLLVLFSAALPGERLRARHLVGAALAFGGAALLLIGRAGDRALFAGGDWTGYGLALACAFIWSIYSVVSRLQRRVETEAVAGFCLATAALSALCHALFESPVWPATATQWAAVIGLGLGPVGVAFYAWDIGVKRGDIRLLGVASYAAPLISTLLLVIAGMARPAWSLAWACLAIAAGAFIAGRRSG